MIRQGSRLLCSHSQMLPGQQSNQNALEVTKGVPLLQLTLQGFMLKGSVQQALIFHHTYMNTHPSLGPG